MNISRAGMDLVKRFTILHFNSYRTESGWAVGYDYRGGTKLWNSVSPQAHVTEKEADRMLEEDMRDIAFLLNKVLTVELTQYQFDALASYAKSVGPECFVKSELLRKINAGDKDADEEFLNDIKPPHAQGIAIVTRRHAEMRLFDND